MPNYYINFLKDFIINRGGKPKPSRGQIMGARPVRNPSVKWVREARLEDRPPVALLQIPRRGDRWGNLLAKAFRLPDFRKVELDEIGSDVWELCDGVRSVDVISRAICVQYKLNKRQGEASVTAYLRMLAERRLVALRTGKTNAGVAAKNDKATSGTSGGGANRRKRA